MLEGISVAVLLATYFAITQIGGRKLAENETKQAKRRWLIAALIPLLLALGIVVIALDARGRSAEAGKLVFMLGSAGATLALLPLAKPKAPAQRQSLKRARTRGLFPCPSLKKCIP
jgi:hypothetical protein